MKGQSKRYADHKGKPYDTHPAAGPGGEPDDAPDDAPDGELDDSVGFLQLWRYASGRERLATLLGVLLSWCSSAAVIAAVVLYGELTSLFVSRHKAAATTGHARILQLFGGGRQLPEGNRSLHMDALVEDSVAFAWASVAIMALQLVSASGAAALAGGAARAAVARLRAALLRHALRQEPAFFDTNNTLNFAATLTEDMDKVMAGMGEHVVMTTYLGGSVALGGALALWYGWQLTLVGLAVVPLAVLVALTQAKYQTRCGAEETAAYGAAGRVVEEALANIRTVRAYGGEKLELERYCCALGPAAACARRRGVLAGCGAGLGWLLTYAMNACVFAYGAVLIVRDMHLPPEEQQYHPGVMVTVLFCTFMCAQNIALCHPHLEVFSAARGAARPAYRLLARRSAIDALGDAGAGVKPDRFQGDIEFDNIYFNYPSRPDVKVLRGLTLSVRAGETVALVGPSGCGKSTLLQLAQRLYAPDSGRVLVDGRRLEELDLRHYRTSIGVVGQEPVLFSGTVRENIAMGLDDVTEERIVAAAKTAHAHQFITKLANGYDTLLGCGGVSLSGGQKQRVAIARAVVRAPALLLLDEPTSALDARAERLVQAALDAAAKGRTTIVVSHRLSTIVNASRIVYMEQGAALEQGSHRELLARRGLYWRLVQDDIATKNVGGATIPPVVPPAGEAPDDDDVTETRDDAPPELRRASSRLSARASQLSRWSVVRGSGRAGGVSAAHVPHTAAPALVGHAEPEETEEEEAEPPVSSWELLKLNAREWPLLAGGGLASFLVGATMPVFALLFSKLYGMFASSDGQEILSQSQLYAGLFAGVAALCGAVTFLQTWLFNRAGAALTDRLRAKTFENYLQQEQGWFDDRANSVGALCARLATDCAAVQGATGTRLGTVLQGVSTMAIGIGLALPYSWKMTLVSLLSVPCVMGGIYLEGWAARRSEKRHKRAMEQASRVATEALLNVRTVQALGVETTMLARYSAALRSAAAASRGAARLRGPVYGLCLCAPTLGYAVSLAYGGYLVAREGLHYEYAILVSEALIYGAWMLAEALSFAPHFAAARRSGARIVRALRRQPAVRDEPTATDDPHWRCTGEVHFDSIGFSYPGRAGARVLRGLTARVAAGRTLALVGPSGCGKSTLLQLLMRAYDPQEGVVELDGKDIKRSLTLSRLRAQLGLVQQEPALFSRSLRDNIAYGDAARPVPMEEVVAAAQQANIHSFIASLPLGYDTLLGPGGAALSGGQKQRVAIARALVRDPRVLLLDEATSALDANSEKAVQEALEAAARQRTTIVIAHRLAAVRRAHTICLIHDGVVAESGSHEELVRRRGLYWGLLQQQAGGAAADDAH